jgi:hypothetical protein
MLKAIHKETGKIVWAWALENNATWIGKEKDEFIAPRYMIYDFKENGDIKVFFTKSHFRDNSPVVAHFKHESNREIYDAHSESKEHKLAKEGIYEAICNGDIIIESKPLKDLCSDIEFEYPISNSKKSKIADVITIFKERHPIYGKGIIFEVQFSNQTKEITGDRTFNRICEGYSVCWLWDGDFDFNNKIKLNRVNIIPFSKAIEEYQKTIEQNTLSKINDAGLMLDRKISHINNTYKIFQEDLANKSTEVINTITDGFRYELEEISASLKNIIASAKEDIRNEDGINLFVKQTNEDIKKECIQKILENHYLDRGIINDLLKQIEKHIIEKEEEILKNTIPKIIDGDKLKEIIIERLNKINPLNSGIVNCANCKKCNNLFPVKSMEFEGGWTYCYPCFNSLEYNWKKKYNDGDKIDGRNKIN